MTKEFSNNHIVLSGEVAGAPEFNHEIYGEKFYVFPLMVSRKSGNTDTLPIMVSERLVDLAGIQSGINVQVSGEIRTYNQKLNESSKARLIISVFARELSFVEPEENDEDINAVVLKGYICKQPNYRKTPLGREICDVLLAVNRPYGKSDYIPCIAWGRNAGYAEGLEVGTSMSIHGRLQSRNYTKRLSEDECEERVAYELSINKLEINDCADDCDSEEE